MSVKAVAQSLYCVTVYVLVIPVVSGADVHFMQYCAVHPA
jgi:hypothetical protein